MALRSVVTVAYQGELPNFVIQDHSIVIAPGYAAWGDQPFKWYYYDVNSSATDDGENFIKPTSVVGNGRYIKMDNAQTKGDWSSSSGYGQILNKPSIPAAQVNSDWNASSGLAQILNKPNIASTVNLSGSPISITKMATGTVSPNTGNGYSIDISGCGFNNVVGYQITPIKNTNVPTSAPKVSVKSVSTSAIVVNVIEGNANTINLLGSLVLLGTSEQFAVTTGLSLHVTVWGN